MISNYLEGKTKLDPDPATNIRTNNWLPKIEEILADKANTAFIAVGLQHVIGPDGLVEYLTSAGYSVEQMGASSDVDLDCIILDI